MKEAGQVLRNEKVKTTDEFLVKKNNLLYYLQIMTKSLNQVLQIKLKLMIEIKLEKF